MYYYPHKKIALFFVFSIIVLFILGLIFLFTREGKMTIKVIPRPEEISLEKTIKIPNDLSGEVFEIEIEKEINSNPKASLEIDDVAKGEVEIINQSNNGQTLVKTTRLLSPQGILFRLDQQVFVPAKGKIKAKVYADKPGKESEIEPTRFIIPGLSPSLQKLIFAQSYEKMTGGTKKIGMVTENDINEAKSKLEEILNKEMEEKIQTELKEKLNEISGLKIILGDKILNIKSEAKPNQEVGEFKTKGKLRVGLVAIKENELLNVAKNLLEKNLPIDKKLSFFDEQSLKYELKTFNPKEKTAEIEIKIKGKITIKENSPLFNLEEMGGQKKQVVKNYLEQYKEIERVEIRSFPFWKNSFPKKKELIEIKIKE